MAEGKRGRPTLYTVELAQEICDRLSAGEPLAWICEAEHMPSVRTVSDWKQAHDDFSANFARARDEGFDAIAANVKRTAETPMMGERVEIERDKDGNERVIKRVREDMTAHRRLIVETNLKLLAKWDPRRYGERTQTELTGPNGGPLQTESTIDMSNLTPEQLRVLAGIAVPTR
jgi:hypothetical protein